jgi:[methyl-Co(III) methanol-specific corrinoid protein]:coenzyme M methyltransferase
MTDRPAPRAEVLTVLNGGPVDRYLCFSGLISVTRPGLESAGLNLTEVHHDHRKMAAAAMSTVQMFGFDSVAVPLDMCVEAEVLGAPIDFGDDGAGNPLPQPVRPLAGSAAELVLEVPADIAAAGRVPIVAEAIRFLRSGEDLAVGAWIPGPFTLASMLIDVGGLLMDTRKDPESVDKVLDTLTALLIGVAGTYREAGADYLTVHEMGGSPGFIGPQAFEGLVLPRLQRLLAVLPAPRVLHVCGRTNPAMELLAAAGADALSVDQLNDLSESRSVLGTDAVLLGNIDPIGLLVDGAPPEIEAAVAAATESGVSAVWPGCDLMPDLLPDNLTAMVGAVRRSRPAEASQAGG